MNYLAIAVLQRAARGRGPAAVDQQKRCRGARAAQQRRGAGAADQQMWRRGGRAARGSGLADRRRCAAAQGSPSPKIRPSAASSSASLSLSFFPLSFYSLSILQGLGGFAARFRARLSISRPALDFPRATRCPARYPIYGARLVLWDAQTTPCDAQEDASCLRRTP